MLNREGGLQIHQTGAKTSFQFTNVMNHIRKSSFEPLAILHIPIWSFLTEKDNSNEYMPCLPPVAFVHLQCCNDSVIAKLLVNGFRYMLCSKRISSL